MCVHVSLLLLRLLPLDLPELAAELSGRVQALHAAQGRPARVPAAVGRRHRLLLLRHYLEFNHPIVATQLIKFDRQHLGHALQGG